MKNLTKQNAEILSKIKISSDITLKEALKKIDEAGHGIVYICDESGKLVGALTDGDIRRRILKTSDLQEKIACCMTTNPVSIKQDKLTISALRKIMLEKQINSIPVVNEEMKMLQVYFWDDVFEEKNNDKKTLDIPVVIMAGGKGERMLPFTSILPKPLIPIGSKPIIELIIDKFLAYGVNRYYVTLNYKGEMIKTYLDSIEKDYTVTYVWEKDFLGTAGSLKLIPNDIGDTFFVSNCDIIVSADYTDLLDFHNANNNILTVVGSIQSYRIPYGVIHFEKEGRIKEIQEKPEFDFTVNTGVYLLSREALDYIPENTSFNMTDLIERLLKEGKNLGVYPISQKSYIDIGQWSEYYKTMEQMKVFL